VPEELYGPLSIKHLEMDQYHRLTDGYLPSAAIAFLDEIFNANSAILNALLTLLNEREFDNGTVRIKTPLVSVVGASNVVPEGTELAALYDRFLFRYQVDPVSDQGFDTLLDTATEEAPISQDRWRLSEDQLCDIRDQAAHVRLPESVKAMVASLRKALVDKKLYVSDRRWTKIVRVLRVAAFCDGRDEVSLVDCWLIVHCLWNRPEQASLARELVRSTLGAVLVDEPKRYEAMLTAFEEEVTRDQGQTEQVLSVRGEALWFDESGKRVNEPYAREQLSNRRGDLLFHAPEGMQRRAKTAFTLEELWDGWFQSQPNGINKLEAWSHNPANHATDKTERKRVEQPRRFAGEHIDGRRRQVADVLRDVRDFLEAIDALRIGTSSLWVPAARQQHVLDGLGEAHDTLRTVARGLEEVIARIDKLPRAEV
jgi:MoxR-like ATPase